MTPEVHGVIIGTMKMLLDAGSKMDESSAIFSILPLAVDYKCNLIYSTLSHPGGTLMLILEVIKLFVSSQTGQIEDAIEYMAESLVKILDNVSGYVEEYEAGLMMCLMTDNHDADTVDSCDIIIRIYTEMIDCLRSIVLHSETNTDNSVFHLEEDTIENGDFYECAFVQAFVKIARYPPQWISCKRLIFVILDCLDDNQVRELSGILSKRMEINTEEFLFLVSTENVLKWVCSFESTIGYPTTVRFEYLGR